MFQAVLLFVCLLWGFCCCCPPSPLPANSITRRCDHRCGLSVQQNAIYRISFLLFIPFSRNQFKSKIMWILHFSVYHLCHCWRNAHCCVHLLKYDGTIWQLAFGKKKKRKERFTAVFPAFSQMLTIALYVSHRQDWFWILARQQINK